MILAAHQPHYLPYPGLIAKIDAADVFVLLDDLQYTKNNWQNRNRIRSADGWVWLTIPVHASSRSRINEVYPASGDWWQRHQRLLALHYRDKKLEILQELWRAAESSSLTPLATIGAATLSSLLRLIGVTTPIVLQSELRLSPEETLTRDARLISLCRRFGCDTYLSGTGASSYLSAEAWRQSGVRLEMLKWMDRPYPQCHPGWVGGLSIVDLILCCDDPLVAVQTGRRIDVGFGRQA
jgi:hypothetical protein